MCRRDGVGPGGAAAEVRDANAGSAAAPAGAEEGGSALQVPLL